MKPRNPSQGSATILYKSQANYLKKRYARDGKMALALTWELSDFPHNDEYKRYMKGLKKRIRDLQVLLEHIKPQAIE
jgi:hypothetical protein